jgi:hypothetical protein
LTLILFGFYLWLPHFPSGEGIELPVFVHQLADSFPGEPNAISLSSLMIIACVMLA